MTCSWPASNLAVHLDAAAHQLDQSPGDGQPEARAAITPGGRTIGLGETLEEMLGLAGRDADARIVEGEAQARAGMRRRVHPHVQVDLAVLGELHRVAHQIDQHLPQPQIVGAEPLGQAGGNGHPETQPLLLQAQGEQVLHLVEHGLQQEGRAVDLQLAGLDLRQVEEIVDEVQQRARRRPDGGEVPALRLAQLALQRQLGEADDRVHRRPDLVADVGQKLRLGGIGRLEPGFVEPLRGHVPIDADHTPGLAPSVALDDPRGVDVAHPPPRQQQAELGFVGLVLLHRRPQHGLRLGRVVGVHALRPEGVEEPAGAHRLRHLVPRHEPLVPIQLAAVDLPRPDADVGGVLRHLQQGHVFPQPALGRDALRDIRDDGKELVLRQLAQGQQQEAPQRRQIILETDGNPGPDHRGALLQVDRRPGRKDLARLAPHHVLAPQPGLPLEGRVGARHHVVAGHMLVVVEHPVDGHTFVHRLVERAELGLAAQQGLLCRLALRDVDAEADQPLGHAGSVHDEIALPLDPADRAVGPDHPVLLMVLIAPGAGLAEPLFGLVAVLRMQRAPPAIVAGHGGRPVQPEDAVEPLRPGGLVGMDIPVVGAGLGHALGLGQALQGLAQRQGAIIHELLELVAVAAQLGFGGFALRDVGGDPFHAQRPAVVVEEAPLGADPALRAVRPDDAVLGVEQRAAPHGLLHLPLGRRAIVRVQRVDPGFIGSPNIGGEPPQLAKCLRPHEFAGLQVPVEGCQPGRLQRQLEPLLAEDGLLVGLGLLLPVGPLGTQLGKATGLQQVQRNARQHHQHAQGPQLKHGLLAHRLLDRLPVAHEEQDQRLVGRRDPRPYGGEGRQHLPAARGRRLGDHGGALPAAQIPCQQAVETRIAPLAGVLELRQPDHQLAVAVDQRTLHCRGVHRRIHQQAHEVRVRNGQHIAGKLPLRGPDHLAQAVGKIVEDGLERRRNIQGVRVRVPAEGVVALGTPEVAAAQGRLVAGEHIAIRIDHHQRAHERHRGDKGIESLDKGPLHAGKGPARTQGFPQAVEGVADRLQMDREALLEVFGLMGQAVPLDLEGVLVKPLDARGHHPGDQQQDSHQPDPWPNRSAQRNSACGGRHGRCLGNKFYRRLANRAGTIKHGLATLVPPPGGA